MSAWKELQLALKDDSKTEEEIAEYERNWASECRQDHTSDMMVGEREESDD